MLQRLIFFLIINSKFLQVQSILLLLILYRLFKCPLAPIFLTTLDVNLTELLYQILNLSISKFKSFFIQSLIILEKKASPAPVESISFEDVRRGNSYIVPS